MFLQPNQKRLLSSLNPIFFVLAVFSLILIRTTGRPLWFGFFQQWDILLPFVVYFGQRRSLAEGLILSLFTSHLYSLSSIAPIGVFVTHYLVLFAIARLLSYVIYADNWFSILLVMLLLSILSRFVLSIVSPMYGNGWPVFSASNFVWWGLLMNAVAGFLVYGMLGALDRFTCKTADVNIELAETEM